MKQRACEGNDYRQWHLRPRRQRRVAVAQLLRVARLLWQRRMSISFLVRRQELERRPLQHLLGL